MDEVEKGDRREGVRIEIKDRGQGCGSVPWIEGMDGEIAINMRDKKDKGNSTKTGWKQGGNSGGRVCQGVGLCRSYSVSFLYRLVIYIT